VPLIRQSGSPHRARPEHLGELEAHQASDPRDRCDDEERDGRHGHVGDVGRTIGVSARRFQRTTALRRALQALAHDENASLARKRRRLDPTSGSRVSQANDVHEQPRSRAIKSA